MISVVLPVYNGEKYLRSSISSVLNQTYRNLELVIVNDCSTDRSLQIAEEFKNRDGRVVIINNESNQKLPKSLNIGFAHCNGDYYTWTSDDNILLPNALETMLKTIKDTGADLVFSRCGIIDINGKRIGATTLYSNMNELYCNNIVLASFLYKKEVHTNLNGYDVNKFLVEDYDFWLRAYRKFEFVYIPEILYEIRFHGENLGTKHLEEVKLGKIELLKDNLKATVDEEVRESIYREISNCYYEISNHYYTKLNSKKQTWPIIWVRVKDVIKKILKM